MLAIIEKIKNLYAELETRMVELKAERSALTDREMALAERETAFKERESTLNYRAGQVAHISNILAEQAKAERLMSDARSAMVKLNNDKENFALEMQTKREEAEEKLRVADATMSEVNATRARLVVEVERVANEKANMRQQLIQELVQGLK